VSRFSLLPYRLCCPVVVADFFVCACGSCSR
jgi:hypothetical protein